MSEKINFKIIDNFLSKEDFDIIKNTIYSKHFPWFYFPNITWADKNSENNIYNEIKRLRLEGLEYE